MPLLGVTAWAVLAVLVYVLCGIGFIAYTTFAAVAANVSPFVRFASTSRYSGATCAIALSVIAIGSDRFFGPIIAGAAAKHLGVAWAFGVAGAANVGGVLLVVFDRLAIPRAAATV